LKTPEEAMDLIENMAVSDIAIMRDRAHIPTKKSLLELTSQDVLLAQNKLLSKQPEALTKTLSCRSKLHDNEPSSFDDAKKIKIESTSSRSRLISRLSQKIQDQDSRFKRRNQEATSQDFTREVLKRIFLKIF